MYQNVSPPRFLAIGQQLRKVREGRGLSRARAAQLLHVDASSISGWESGRRLPRLDMRRNLAELFSVDISTLFPSDSDTTPPPAVSLIDTHSDLPDMLLRFTVNATRSLRALRLSAPYPTPAHVQIAWRKAVSERLRNHSVAVQRIEIIYDLRRLQEITSNIMRYDGCNYQVKCFCAGLAEVVPAMGGYFFDDDQFVFGAYWTGVPPGNQPGIHLTGEPFRTFFNAYWDEIWRRGTFLNVRGAHDLSEIEAIARKLGLQPRQWPRFVEQARAFEVGDGAPPFV